MTDQPTTPDLTPAGRARLREICVAATPGPWRIMLDGLKHREPIAVVADDAELAARFPHDGEALRTHQIFLAHAAKDGDLAFAVAWNPETTKAVLALIEQQQEMIDTLEAENAKLHQLLIYAGVEAAIEDTTNDD